MQDIFQTILTPALIIGGVGLVFGLILAFSSRAFAVKVDERIKKVREALPGANCGACGEAGCDSFAEAVVSGKIKHDRCSVGGAAVATQVAAIMGVEATNTVSYTARVFCGGNQTLSQNKYQYEGIKTCQAAVNLFYGPKACPFGCLGFGDCAKACPFGAIEVKDGLARILEDRCRSCEQCVAACPKKIIAMVPRNSSYFVACKNTQKGGVTRKACSVGCIGCGKCAKTCPHQAITIENNLAKIDPLLCQNCGECLKVCPTKAIESLI